MRTRVREAWIEGSGLRPGIRVRECVGLLVALVAAVGCEPPHPDAGYPSLRTLDGDEPACPSSAGGDSTRTRCEIGVVPGVEIGGGGRPGEPDIRSLPAATSDGRILAPTYGEGTIGVWSPEGRFLDTFGRPGEGPGEIRGTPSVAVDGQDTIHVRDGVGRWSLWGPDGTFGRVVPAARAIRPFLFTAVTRQGDLVGPNSTGDSLLRLDKRTGEAEGLPPPLPPPEEGGYWSGYWIVFVDRDGTLWLLSTDGRLQRRSSSGEVVFDRRLDPEWLPTPPESAPPPEHVYPVSAPLDVWHAPGSPCLWVVARRAVSTEAIHFEEMRRQDDEADSRIHDYVVACLSPDDGSVRATAVDDGRDGRLRGFLRDGRVYRGSIDRTGLLALKFFELRLVAPG